MRTTLHECGVMGSSTSAASSFLLPCVPAGLSDIQSSTAVKGQREPEPTDADGDSSRPAAGARSNAADTMTTPARGELCTHKATLMMPLIVPSTRQQLLPQQLTIATLCWCACLLLLCEPISGSKVTDACEACCSSLRALEQAMHSTS